MKTAAVIPAYDEEERIGDVVREAREYVDEVLVVDDGSADSTAEAARESGAEVIEHGENRGYLRALRTGFRSVEADVIVTLDADGEMDPSYIPVLVEPIESGEADLVLGSREEVPRVSERLLSALAGLRLDVSDTGTGYRALTCDLAKRMELEGVCPCGTFVLEAKKLGAEILEVPVVNRKIRKPKGVAWKHFLQFWYLVWSHVSR